MLSRSADSRFPGNALAFASVVLAACVAAALAHVAIDVAGDYVLPHDAYDGVRHTSRLASITLAAAFLLGTAACALWAAVLERRTGRMRLRAMIGATRLPSWGFVASIVGATFVALIAMEALDTFLQRGAVDDVADLLGGSIPLAIAIVVPIAMAVAASVHGVLGALLRSCRDFVAAAGSSFVRLARAAQRGSFHHGKRRAMRLALRSPLLARHAGNRAPPLSFAFGSFA